MVVIFGVTTRTSDYGAAYHVECPACENEVLYHAWKERDWIHLFWIPILPLSATHGFVCPVCSSVLETDRRGFELGKSAADTIEQRNRGDAEPGDAVDEFERIDEYLDSQTD